MVDVTREIERKYDVEPGLGLPDLSEVDGVDRVGAPVVHELIATYLDTPDLRLRAAGITLRHRAGGTDAGWHLKIPIGADREEVHAEGTDPTAAVPDGLLALVRAVTRTATLLPVARLTTRRTAHRLLDAAGAVLVEVVDDQVEGLVLDPPSETTLRWREWEAELGIGPGTLLDDVEQRLLAAGAVRSDTGSKVGRVLASRPADPTDPPWWANSTSKLATAGQVVQSHLAQQVAELVARDPQVRRDQPDAVHKMRVASRRLRSALHTFRSPLDRSQTDPLRDELRWLTGVLGGPRDVEVMHARLRNLVAAEPPELILGPVLRRIDMVLGQRYRTAHANTLAELDSARYLTLLDALDALALAPSFTEKASGSVQDVLAPMVRATWTRLDRAMRDAEQTPAGADQDRLLHEARKLAKAARYAAESAAPAFGRRALRFAGAMADLQEVLGSFQDGIVTREVLRELGAGSSRAGENGFTFGRLHGLEQARAKAVVAQWPKVRKQVSKPGLTRWLD